MFTGIITNFGSINNLEKTQEKDLFLEISTQKDKVSRKLDIGCSISCNGICLTLIAKIENADQHLLQFQASNETCSKTTIANWQKNQLINLEFSLRAGDEFGGHMVSGHVDDKSQIISIIKNDQSHIFEFTIPRDLKKFIVKKGSIAIDGVSLTINEVKKTSFMINVISHTFENTIFQNYKTDDFVNLEIDTIARYIGNYL